MVAMATRVAIKNEKENIFDKRKDKMTLSGSQWVLVSLMFVFTAGLLAIGILLGLNMNLQIRKLQEEIEQNGEEVQYLREVYKGKHSLINVGGHNVTNDDKSILRTRRQSGQVLIVAHLVGTRGSALGRRETIEQVPSPYMYFEWSGDDENLCIVDMMVVVKHKRSGTFLEIKRTGYYYVYAQVTYDTKGKFQTGHETVRKSGDREIVLMQTLAMQRLGSAKNGVGNRRSYLDSSHHGGVFLLFEEDLIGVRPALYEEDEQHFRMDKTKSFFGLYFVHD